MQVVRRLYVYFIAGVSLAILVVGLVNLLQVALAELWVAINGGVIEPGSDVVRREISLFTALVVVALPIWLLHWWLAERAVLRPGGEGEAERVSSVRALYLALGLLVPFGFAVRNLFRLLDHALNQVFSTLPTFATSRTGTDAIATVAVTGAVWAYHVYVRRRDMRAGPLAGPAAWLPRLYLYIAAFTGAMFLLFGATGLIRLILDATIGREVIVGGEQWWVTPLAGGIAAVLVGLLVWGAHWGYSLSVLARDDWQGQSERQSGLRRVYLYLLILVGVFMTLAAVTGSLESLFRWLLGIPAGGGEAPLARRLIEPLLAAIPFAISWAYHRREVLAEARRYAEAPLQASTRRLYTYAVALVGLAFASVGLAYVLGLVLDRALGGSRTLRAPAGWWSEQVAQFSALALVGAGAWLWHWYTAERQVAADPEAERAATTRRVYLYATLAASLVAILSSLAVVIYRVLTVVLGVGSSRGLVSDISTATGVVVVAAALLAYHGLILRQDLAARPEAAAEANALPLLLAGPTGADLEAALADLRAHLPEGYTLSPGKRRGDS